MTLIAAEDHNLAEEDCPVRWGIEDDLYPGDQTKVAPTDLQKIAPNLTSGQHQELVDDFSSVFQAVPGCTTVIQHQIHGRDAMPIRHKPYRIPYSRPDLVKKELKEIEAAGMIQPSTSPCASPIVLVEKMNGGIRFCVDYQKLNQVAKFNAYPMSHVEKMFESIGFASVITTLDLAKGYWEIPMAPESK